MDFIEVLMEDPVVDRHDINGDDIESRISLLETRVLGVEQTCGIPDCRASRWDKIKSLVIFQTYHKLLIFGKAACPIALLVLLATAAFVVGFSIHQMRNTCVPNGSLIDGDLPAFANQINYRDSGNIFVCTTQYNNLIFNASSFLYWTPCTLRGLSEEDYDLKGTICPVAYNGCYRNPNNGADSNNSHTLVDGINEAVASEMNALSLPVEVCASQGQPEVVCQGVVSITYYSCPNAGITIGAALGYSGLVQIAAVIVFVVLYLITLSVITGQCHSVSTMMQAFGSPRSTLDQVARENNDTDRPKEEDKVEDHLSKAPKTK